MDFYPSLFNKKAEEEPFYSNANLLGAEGATRGAVGGALLGAGAGFIPSMVLKGVQRKFPHKNLPIPKITKQDQLMLSGSGAVVGGLGGAATGYAYGAGIGGLMDHRDIKKQEKEREFQEYKNEVRERMQELQREASEDISSRLAKTAGILKTIRTASGIDVAKAKRAYNKIDNPDTFYNTPPDEYFNGGSGGIDGLNAAKVRLNSARYHAKDARKDLLINSAPAALPVALAGSVGYGLYQQKKLDDRVINELLEEQQEGKRQGAGGVSDAPAGVDKTAEASSPSFQEEYDRNPKASWPSFQEEYDRNPGQRQGVENDRKVIRGEHLPYAAGVGAIPGLGGGMFLAGLGGFGKSNAGKLLGVAGTTAVGAGLGYQQGKVIQNFTKDVSERGVNNAGRDDLTDQERFFVDRSKMVLDGLDRTASVTPLFTPLNKTAGPINFIKNLSGSNVKKQQNKLDTIKSVPTVPQGRADYTKVVEKDLKNSKADRNRARLGTGAALVGGGAAVGGYNSYQNTKEPVVDEMNQQYQTDNERIAFEQLIGRLEKTAGPMDFIRGAGQHAGDALAAAKAGGADAYVSARNLGQNAIDGITSGAQNAGNAIAGGAQTLGQQAQNLGQRASGANYRNFGREYGDTMANLPENALAREGRIQMYNDARKAALQDTLKANATIAGGLAGAGGLGYGAHALATRGDDDEEQVAFEQLIDSLEKTAANPRQMFGDAIESARDFGYDAKQAFGPGYINRMKGNEVDALESQFQNARGTALAESEIGQAQRQRDIARYGTGLGAAGVGAGVGAGAYALANRGDEEEQVAFEQLIDSLEKTAAGAGFVAKGKKTLGDAKYKAQMKVRDFTGANEKATAQNMQRLWEDPKYQAMPVEQFKKTQGKFKDANDAAANRRDTTRKQVGIGAAGLAAGTGAGAAATSRKKDEEKTASENVLNDLYKEAASAILNEDLPEIRKHVDPIKKIAFNN